MNPWDMMGGGMPPQMQQMQGMQGMPQQMQQPQQPPSPWDYPGVKEAIGEPLQYTPYIPQELDASAQQQKVPWNDLMGAGYGAYL
jgi:hypothetical protein